MELLPALALGVGFAASFLLAVIQEFKPREAYTIWQRCAASLFYVVVILDAGQMMRERPLTYVEGLKNIEARRNYEIEIPPVLRTLLAARPGAAVLMDTSTFPNLVAFTGIPLRQTINESDLGIYTAALAAPASHAVIVLAFDGDQIDRAVKAHPEDLTAVRRFSTPGQPAGTIYTSDKIVGP